MKRRIMLLVAALLIGIAGSRAESSEAFYAKAETLLAADDYDGAVQAFTQAGDYTDAAARAKETLYRQAGRLLSRGQDAEAYEAYRRLRGFWDVDDILKKTPRLRRAFIDVRFAPGKRLTFGRYEQDGDPGTGPEPIEWIVLEKRKDRALLLSVYALDARPYNDLYTEVTWEYSALRDWLNLDFVPAAFLPEEQAFVLSSYVTNENDQGYSHWRTRSGRGTRDSAFLLSYLQTRRYETRVEDLLTCAPTAYALTRGIEADGDRCSWWLRSPGEYQDYAAYIGPDGALGSEYVTKDTFGVRPAFWIDLTNDPI